MPSTTVKANHAVLGPLPSPSRRRSRTMGREPLRLEGASCCPLQLGVLRCGVRTKTRAPQTRSCRDRDWRCSRAYGHDSRTSSLARSHEEAVVCTRLDEVGKLLHVDRLQDIAQSLEFSDFRSKLRELGDHRIHPLTERLLDYYRATTPAPDDRLRGCRHDRCRTHGWSHGRLRLVLASLGTAHSTHRGCHGRFRGVLRSLRAPASTGRPGRHRIQQGCHCVRRICLSSCHRCVTPSADCVQVATLRRGRDMQLPGLPCSRESTSPSESGKEDPICAIDGCGPPASRNARCLRAGA